MATARVLTMEGEVSGEVELPAALFAAKAKEGTIHAAIVAELANRRAGTASTLKRSEVRGGGRKPWRQKGTGRARHGSRRSPLWVGGGTVFGPRPRDYYQGMPKKAKRKAILAALSHQADQGAVKVLEDIRLPEVKTRLFAQFLSAVKAEGNVLVVLAQRDEVVEKSARNIPGVQVRVAPSLSLWDILTSRHILLTKAAVAKLEACWGKG